MSRAYQEEISERHPLLFVVVLDPSAAASADRVLAGLNEFLYAAAMRYAGGRGITNHFYVALLGAGNAVHSAFAGTLVGREVVAIRELAEHPLRVAEKTLRL